MSACIELRHPARAASPRTLLRVAVLLLWVFANPLFVAPVANAAQTPIGAQSTEAIRASRYMDQLLSEINARRAMAGTPPIVYAASAANAAVDRYLADLTPMMLAYNSCFHGTGDPVRPAWDYVAMSGLAGEPRGEVIACPDSNGFWTAKKIADGWWDSPMHHMSLYADWDANAVACGAYGSLKGGSAYQTIACVTYRI